MAILTLRNTDPLTSCICSNMGKEKPNDSPGEYMLLRLLGKACRLKTDVGGFPAEQARQPASMRVSIKHTKLQRIKDKSNDENKWKSTFLLCIHIRQTQTSLSYPTSLRSHATLFDPTKSSCVSIWLYPLFVAYPVSAMNKVSKKLQQLRCLSFILRRLQQGISTHYNRVLYGRSLLDSDFLP